MKKLLFATVAAVALIVPAKADIILDTKLSGTGDNVVFDSVNVSGHTALGHLNDPNAHQEVVRFGALDLSPTFNGAQNGNDIKITGTNDLEIQVFDKTNTFVVGTTEQVFSLTGDGTVKLFVQAQLNGVDEALKTFILDPLKSGQNGFTLTAINGEVMTSLIIFDTNGTITDFEHYRIDVAPTAAAVPGPIVGAGLPGLIAACMGLVGFNWRRRRKNVFRLA